MARQWTPEEREAQRLRMQQLHAEGRAGPQFGRLGGRPSTKRRVAEVLEEKAQDKAEKIWRRLEQILDGESDRQAIEAIKVILQTEDHVHKERVREERDLEQLSRAELELYILDAFRELKEAGFPGLESFDVIDVEYEEAPRAIGPGEGASRSETV